MDQTAIFDPFPEAVYPANLVFGGAAASLQPPVYPGAVTGSAGNSGTVMSDYAGTTGNSAVAAQQYGAAKAAGPFWNQPIFWAVAVFGLGVWLLAHIALVEVKS